MSTSLNAHGFPRLPLNLSEHKLPIALNWGAIVLTSGLLPLVGFFALRYGTDETLSICLAPWLALMGVVSVFSLLMRSWSLVKKNSTCRPLGVKNAVTMDYFGWNFWAGFVSLSVLITLGSVLEELLLVSLPLSVLMLDVCAQLLLVQVLISMGVRAPFRFSSVARGQPIRPGSYAIAEDVVAVEGKQGQHFRQAWNDRYEASAAFRSHLRRVDLLWGSTGLCVVGLIWGVVFGVENHQIGFAVGECYSADSA